MNDILKQRLVGALILVALGVVFWPIILNIILIIVYIPSALISTPESIADIGAGALG